jgi:ribosome biogenesis GTPase A
MENNSHSWTSDESHTNRKVSDRISDMKKRHIQELREAIQKYKVLNRRESKNLDYSNLPSCCNIIVFGPSKTGKSSLIK